MNCIIWGNTDTWGNSSSISDSVDVFYSNVEDGYPGVGNIDDYPEFVDTANGDYHLAENSPCIGNGIDSLEIAGVWYRCPFTDLEGNPRPNPLGTMPDMGAYENAPLVGIEENISSMNPVSFYLSQNYPNPFNPTTKIKFSIPQKSQVVIKVFDVLGNEIETLVNEEKLTGTYELTWGAEGLTSGVYFYKIKAGVFVETKKMILIK